MSFPVSADAIAAAEKVLGVKFPHLFAQCMRKLNGGYVLFEEDEWRLHPFEDRSTRKMAGRTADSIVRETYTFRELPWFPDDGVVIASLDGNCLFLKKENDDDDMLGDTVFQWDLRDGCRSTSASVSELLAKGWGESNVD